MNEICVHLFGRFCVECSGLPMTGIDGGKPQELFCYLLLHRNRPQPREELIDLLWCGAPALGCSKRLRQALWHLNGAMRPYSIAIGCQVVLVEPEWVCINPSAPLWVDVAVFEQNCNHVQGVPGRALDTLQVQALCDAVRLYRGDLLEGLYLDWCLFERERLQNLYLAALDKLIDYAEAHGEYEAAVTYGIQALRYDQARECTHRRLMRLHFLAGDRTAALRQYDQCVEILRRELAVEPATSTVALYEQIRRGRLSEPGSLSRTAERLKQIQSMLAKVQSELEREIRELEGGPGI